MTRFEISGEVAAVTDGEFFVNAKNATLWVPIRQDQDKPKKGDKVTIAVEVH